MLKQLNKKPLPSQSELDMFDGQAKEQESVE